MGFEELMRRRRRFPVPVIDKPLSLRANFTWTFVGNVVYSACQWGMLAALAKLGSAEMVGQFSLGLAVSAPIVMFTNLQLRAVQATDARGEYAFGDYLGLRLLMTALALMVIVGVVLVFGYRAETAWVVLVVALGKAFEAVSDVFYGLFQRYERMELVARSQIVKGLLSLAMLGAGVYLTGSALWGVAGLAVAWALTLGGYEVRNGALILKASERELPVAMSGKVGVGTTLQPRWEMRTLGRLMWLTLPLGVVMALASLDVNIPRYFIEQYLGERELGIFVAIAYLPVAGRMGVIALGQSATPRLARYYTEGDTAAFRTLLLKLLGIGVLLGVAGVLVTLVAGREILTLLYRPEYAEHADILVWVMLAGGIWYVASMLGFGATASRRVRFQPLALCAVVVVSFGACYILVPTHGLWGASVSMVAGSVMAMLSYSLLVVLD